MCGAVITRLIAEGTGRPLQDVPRGRVRPPVKPVRIEVLATTEVPEAVA